MTLATLLRGPRLVRCSCPLIVGVAALGLVLPGCGGSGDHSLAPVSGKVTLDGKAMPGIQVTFQPMAPQKGIAGPGSSAVTDAEGRYTLKTVGTSPRPGAVVGKHTVRFAKSDQRASSDDSLPAVAKDPVPAKDREQGRPFDVPAGGTDKADFVLTAN
jgi:hypothetical protein